ncbi:hypothetical protein HPE56_11730 [Maribacter sp. ANRC-HE7]|uniref:Uncharacterized protein n=1 Tax=Maribacter aquimaris TaxID=2737171 RepID=A0ABR7V1J5_9FLAO|nr:hypothetical protein [Maribacter aquimaris]MBD0778466.1 hypothetical protein [Maribacter aquimaris]
MDETRIEEIVRRVFDKAKFGCVSHSRYALSKYVSEATGLSSKTLERAYDKYINGDEEKGDGEKWAPNSDSVDFLCVYLGYEHYADYVSKNAFPNNGSEQGSPGKGGVQMKWILYLLGMTLIVFVITSLVRINQEPKCMTWVATHYEEVPCSTQPSRVNGMAVVPYDKSKIMNFKKVEVTMATPFFSEVNQRPLIWYHKTKEGEIEYFTAPGLHPVTGKTLDAITPYMIQKYVPLHTDNPESYVK